MNPKIVVFGDLAREKLKKGVDLIADAVKATLGPRGRNVIYGNPYGYSKCTKDGVTVAREVEAKDHIEKLGLSLIRQAAQKTADDCGDGTTTVTLLAQEIVNEGLQVIRSKTNPILVNQGMQKAVKEALAFIDSVKLPVETADDIIKVATLSANNDREIGELIERAINKVTKDGIITLEDNYHNDQTYIETVEGMRLNEGLQSVYFTTDQDRREAYYQNPLLVIIDSEITQTSQVDNILTEALKTGQPVVLMANGFHNLVLHRLVEVAIKLPLAVVRAPYFGEYRSEQLLDIAILTGGRVLGPGSGILPEKATVDMLGRCDFIRADRVSTTIVGGKGSKAEVDARIALIKDQIEKQESDYEKEKLRERLCKLTTGVAVIKVGAATEVVQKEKKMRVEDALLATKAALEEGIVPGGGVTLFHAGNHIKEEGAEEELIGRRIIKKALMAPIKQIASNAGIDGAGIIAHICLMIQNEGKPYSYGYDFLRNQYGNLLTMGVIDPAKVVKSTLVNAAEVAGMLLTVEVACAEEWEPPDMAKTPRPKGM